jgi:hypothetical protein
MATGIFEAPPAVVARDSGPDAEGDYRAISGVAIAAAALGLASPLAFFDWWLAVVPVLGIVLGSVALRDIARRPTALTGRPLALAAMLVSAVALGGGLVRLATIYAAELPEGFERLSYAALQPLPGDPADAVPETARAADGRNVLLKGYMFPGAQVSGIRQFLLVRDQGDCCFGGNPKITDRVLVTLAEPAGVAFTPRLVKIAGRFSVRPAGAPEIGGGVLYHLEDARAR